MMKIRLVAALVNLLAIASLSCVVTVKDIPPALRLFVLVLIMANALFLFLNLWRK